MNNDEARLFISLMMEGYKKRKEQNRLYSADDFIPENIITTYYDFVIKPEFSFVIEEYKKQYVFNEARVEPNVSKEEVAGLGTIYDYIQAFDFDKDYFNIFTTSLILHQKLYSKCPNPHFGGTLRDCDAILYDLPIDVPTAKIAFLHLNVRAIQRQHVIHALIHEGSVMGNENKSFFLLQISCDLLSGLHIQMIRGLVDEQEMIFPQK